MKKYSLNLIFFYLFLQAGIIHAEEFKVIVMPDTQYYAESYPQIYLSQTQWILDHYESDDIKFVTHLGDVVNAAGEPEQWLNAYAAMKVLDDGEIPYGIAGGNHDFLYPGDYYDPDGQNFLEWFHPSRFEGKPWFGGASPSGLSNYQMITSNGRSYMFLHLLLETPVEELAWAQTVLNQHPDVPVWISTHRYLYDWSVLGRGRYNDFNYAFEPLYRHDGMKANDFFENFVAANPQIYMVYCGHVSSEWYQRSENNFGHDVHEILADYQGRDNGGNGWLRIATFKAEENTIEMSTYSSYLNRWETDSNSQFNVRINLDNYKQSASLLGTELNQSPELTKPLSASSYTVFEGEELELSFAAKAAHDTAPLIFKIEEQNIAYQTGQGSISHHMLFEDDGLYSFAASISDNKVEVDAGHVTIRVLNRPPEILSLNKDMTISKNSFLDYAVLATDAGIFDKLSYAWDLNGDGIYDDAYGASGRKLFEKEGVYSIAVKVSDDDGDASMGRFTLQVL